VSFLAVSVKKELGEIPFVLEKRASVNNPMVAGSTKVNSETKKPVMSRAIIRMACGLA
jgi:hypothetical protein